MDGSMCQGGASLVPTINFEDCLLSLDTHPCSLHLACGTVDGDVAIYSIGNENKSKGQLSISRESCRSVRFSKSGKSLYCGMKDKCLKIIDTDIWSVSQSIPDAHSSSINTLYPISERLLASGDESGLIKVWDSRVRKEVFSISENTDYISDMISDSNKNTLLCTSGDGSLTAVDMRQRKLEQRSDCSESELLCVTIVKGGSRVVCGDGEGVLGIFMWGLWGDITDRYPVSRCGQSIDACIQTSNSVICTGGLDGTIRAIQIIPNKIISEIGHQSDDYPVDNLKLVHDGSILVSGSHDCIKFWSAADIPKIWIDSKGDEDSDEKIDRKGQGRKRRRKKRRRELFENSKEPKKDDNFFDDL